MFETEPEKFPYDEETYYCRHSGEFDQGRYEVDDYGVCIHLNEGPEIPLYGTNFYGYIRWKRAKITDVRILPVRDKDGWVAYEGYIYLEITGPNRHYQVGASVSVSFYASWGRQTVMTNDLNAL